MGFYFYISRSEPSSAQFRKWGKEEEEKKSQYKCMLSFISSKIITVLYKFELAILK